jgi:hypothetical protein
MPFQRLSLPFDPTTKRCQNLRSQVFKRSKKDSRRIHLSSFPSCGRTSGPSREDRYLIADGRPPFPFVPLRSNVTALPLLIQMACVIATQTQVQRRRESARAGANGHALPRWAPAMMRQGAGDPSPARPRHARPTTGAGAGPCDWPAASCRYTRVNFRRRAGGYHAIVSSGKQRPAGGAAATRPHHTTPHQVECRDGAGR